MSRESQDKIEKLRKQVLDALSKPSDGSPEPKYLLVEERYLVGLANDIEHMTRVKTLEGMKEVLREAEEYVKELIKNSDSVSEEERTILMSRQPARNGEHTTA